MPTQHDTDFAASALADHFGVFGEAVTYTPAGGADVACTGIAGPEQDDEEETLDGRRRKRVREVSLRVSEVASPALNATVTIGGVEYAVDAVVSRDANATRVRLRRLSALEVTIEKYRDG